MSLRVFVLVICFSCFNANSKPLLVLTESLPPMQIVEDGKLVGGMATELVKALLKQVGEKPKIHSYNWARAYKIAQERENVLIFSIVRYPSREQEFKWVGRIYSLSNYLWKLKSRDNIKINVLNDAKQYRTATIRADVQHLHLQKLGFDEQQHLVLTSSLNQALELMFRGRVDLFVASDTFLPEYLKATKYTMADVEPIIRINSIVDNLHIAFSAKTSDKQVTRFKKAYQMLKDNGTYEKVIKKWEDKLGVNKL